MCYLQILTTEPLKRNKILECNFMHLLKCNLIILGLSEMGIFGTILFDLLLL